MNRLGLPCGAIRQIAGSRVVAEEPSRRLATLQTWPFAPREANPTRALLPGLSFRALYRRDSARFSETPETAPLRVCVKTRATRKRWWSESFDVDVAAVFLG
jgi:hypothetical protein